MKNKQLKVDTPEYNKSMKEHFFIQFFVYLLVGGVLGFLGIILIDFLKPKTMNITNNLLSKGSFIQFNILPWILLIIIIGILIYNGIHIHKAKQLIKTWNQENEDQIELADSYLNKSCGTSSLVMIINQVFFAMITYNLLKNLDHNYIHIHSILIAIGIYFIGFFANFFQQNYIIKLVKKYSPEKKGSLYDKKFIKQWENSCDEAELHILHLVGYKTCQALNTLLSAFLTITTIIGMFIPIGFLCSLTIGIIWIIMNIIFNYYAIKYNNTTLE